jgi:hypothetical protein
MLTYTQLQREVKSYEYELHELLKLIRIKALLYRSNRTDIKVNKFDTVALRARIEIRLLTSILDLGETYRQHSESLYYMKQELEEIKAIFR